MKFLISRLSSLGDVVCSLPAASALKSGFPDAEVTWIVEARFAEIVRACGAVDRVVLRGEPITDSFDAALDLQGLLKSALLVARAKAKLKLGFHWRREGAALFSQAVIPDPTSLHVVDRYVDVARAAGGVADYAEFALRPAPLSEALDSKLPKDFVVLNPGAGWAAKRWAPAKFAQLIDALPLPAVLIGAPGEQASAEVAAQCREKPVDLGGQTSIADLIAVIDRARAHVGGDTGSSHLAAALRVPAIGLYSATRPERSCPYGQIERCHTAPNGLDGIEVRDVLRTVEDAL